jgi:hypothetical protein
MNTNTNTPARSLSLSVLSLAAELLARPRGVSGDFGELLASALLADAQGEEYLARFGYGAGLSSDARAEGRFALAVRETALERYLREGACDPRMARLSWAEELDLIRRALARTRPA